MYTYVYVNIYVYISVCIWREGERLDTRRRERVRDLKEMQMIIDYNEGIGKYALQCGLVFDLKFWIHFLISSLILPFFVLYAKT